MYVWHSQVCHAVDLRSAWEKQIAYNPSQLLQACEGLHGLCWRTMFFSGNGKGGNSQPIPSISSYTHAVFSRARDISLKGERRNKPHMRFVASNIFQVSPADPLGANKSVGCRWFSEDCNELWMGLIAVQQWIINCNVKCQRQLTCS